MKIQNLKAELKKNKQIYLLQTLSKYLTVYGVDILDIVQFFAFKINRNLIATTPIILQVRSGEMKKNIY